MFQLSTVKKCKVMDKEQNAVIMFLFEYRNLFVVYTIYICIKVKFNLEQATKAQKGSRGIALLYL